MASCKLSPDGARASRLAGPEPHRGTPRDAAWGTLTDCVPGVTRVRLAIAAIGTGRFAGKKQR
jgi:hypothetical protein